MSDLELIAPARIKAMLKTLKAGGLATSKVEADLKFSNGLLGKAASGTTGLSAEKMTAFTNYYNDVTKNMPKEKTSFDGIYKTMAEQLKDLPPLPFPIPDKPYFAPPWVKKIEEYCGLAGITPEELIEQHAMKGARKTKIEMPIIKGDGNPVPIKIKSEEASSKIPDNYASLTRTEKMKLLKK